MKEKSTGFNDSNVYRETLGFEECYDKCVFNKSCLAVMWNQRICEFITDTSNPINCPESYICTTQGGSYYCLTQGESYNFLTKGESQNCLTLGESYNCLNKGERNNCLTIGENYV